MIKAENLSIEILSACLKTEGHSTKLEYSNKPDFFDKVKSYSPDIIAYSITTGMHYGMLQVNKRLKEQFSNFIGIFGGPHATFHPEIIDEHEGVDIVCVGEGEGALVELANALRDGLDYSGINNLWVRTKTGVNRNPLRDAVSIDTLPYYDRSIYLDADPVMKESTSRIMMASRGCPYSCTYCFNRTYKAMYKGRGKILRLMPIPRAIEELKHLLNAAPNTTFIEFLDDIFPYADKNDFDEFHELYKKEIGLSFATFLPPKHRDFDFIKKLKEAGCRYVGVGFECGDQNIRRDILKRPNYTNEDIINTLHACNKVGLKSFTTNLVGLPVENSLRNDLNTLKVNIVAKPTIALSYMTYPYPGTELARIAVEKGFISKDKEININNKADSPFDFGADQLAIEKTALMFGIIVEFPILLHIHGLLLLLPKSLWNFLYLAHRGYKYRISFNADYSIKNLINNIKTLINYLKYVKIEKLQVK